MDYLEDNIMFVLVGTWLVELGNAIVNTFTYLAPTANTVIILVTGAMLYRWGRSENG